MSDYELLLNLAAKNLVKDWLLKTENRNIAEIINYECVYTLITINDILNSRNTDEVKLRMIKEQISKSVPEKREPIVY